MFIYFVRSQTIYDVKFAMKVDGKIVSSRTSKEITSEQLTTALETVMIVDTQVVYSVKAVQPDGTVTLLNTVSLGETFTDDFVPTDLAKEMANQVNTLTNNEGMYKFTLAHLAFIAVLIVKSTD